MTTRETYMYLYKMGSAGGKKLAEHLDVLRIKHEGSTIKSGKNINIINWGAGGEVFPDRLLNSPILLNHPSAVFNSVNKLRSYNCFAGKCRTPEYTTSKKVADLWVFDGHKVLARSVLEGKQGEGAFLYDPKASEQPSAKVWCKVIPSTYEYRVHVVRDKVVYYQIKKKHDESGDNINPCDTVKSFDHGWKLVNLISVTPHKDVATQAIAAVAALGLDFGAADVGFDKTTGKAYVFEVNTAPWLNDNVADAYATALKGIISDGDAKSAA